MPDWDGYRTVVAEESARFRAALSSVDPATSVPSCPDWSADDLLWHLAEVQYFWGRIVELRLADPDTVNPLERPESHGALLGLFDSTSTQLQTALATASVDEAVWTWSTDQTVGFVVRRQAHEAAIHRVDAELVSGSPITRLEPRFAADGVREVLVHFLGVPAWAEFTRAGPGVLIESSDTGDSWTVQVGSIAGTSPASGTTYEGLATAIVADGECGATVSAPAHDLDLWLWGRGEGIVIEGDAAIAANLRAVLQEVTE